MKKKPRVFDEGFDTPLYINDGDTGEMISRRQYSREEALTKFNEDGAEWELEDLQEGWVCYRFNNWFEYNPGWIVTMNPDKPASNAQPIWYVEYGRRTGNGAM